MSEVSSSDKPEPIDAEIVPDPPAAHPAPAPSFDYDEHGVPSFDYVRSKIEDRYATSVGATELAADTVQGRTVEQQASEHAAAATAKLDEIRRSLRN